MNIDAKFLNKILQTEFSNTSKSSYTMIKLGLFKKCKDSSIYANQSMWNSILINLKNYMIISRDAEKSLWQNSAPIYDSVQFSRSVVSASLRSHESQHARPPCPLATPGVHSKSCPSSRWWHPAISSSVVPFSSCHQSLPASESFPMSQLFAWGGQSTEVSALAYASKFGKLSSGHRTGKSQFSSQSQRKAMSKKFQLLHNCTHLTH